MSLKGLKKQTRNEFEEEFMTRTSIRIKQLSEEVLDQQLRLVQERDISHAHKLSKNNNYA